MNENRDELGRFATGDTRTPREKVAAGLVDLLERENIYTDVFDVFDTVVDRNWLKDQISDLSRSESELKPLPVNGLRRIHQSMLCNGTINST